MNQFHNTNVVFRCPAELKHKMRAVAEGKNQQLSTLIRSACVEFLRREVPSFIPPTDPKQEAVG